MTAANQLAGYASSLPNFRNRIINGDMRIDQRNAGGAVTTANSYPVDRFSCLHITDGAFSAQQDSSAPSGFTNSIKWTTTTADTSFAATQHALVRQKIEGNNIYDLEFGTASAKTITLSFWVKSSLTGTFGGSLMNNGQTRCYPYSYTISTADTWEHKSITIPGDTDTSITWLTTNGVGLEVFWSMGVGSDYDGTAGVWTSTPYQYSVTGAVSVMGTLNANWYLTGVQLEIGSSATPFEHRPIGVEENLCYRYYYRMTADPVNVGGTTNAAYIGFAVGRAYSTTAGTAIIYLPVPLRTSPPVLNFTPVSGNNWDYNASNIQLVNRQNADKRAIAIFANIAVAQSQSSWLLSSGNLTSSTDSVFIDFSAEL